MASTAPPNKAQLDNGLVNPSSQSNREATKNLQNAHGLRKDRTKDFLQIKNRINLFKDPSKRYAASKNSYRFEPTTKAIAFDSFGVREGVSSRHSTNK